MSDTNINIPIPANEWVDLYALSGISVGEPLLIENTGVCDINLTVRATQPPADWNAYNILQRFNGIRLANHAGAPGAWAYCPNLKGELNISPGLSAGFHNANQFAFRGGLGSGIVLDALGRQKVVNDFNLFQALFTFDVSPFMWLVEENDIEVQTVTSTRALSINGRLDVSSGANPGDNTLLESRRHPRYQPDRGMKWAASIGFKDAALDGILQAGLFVKDENGVYLQTEGDGNLYAIVLNNGVETHKEQIIFPFDIDITKGNLYDIQFQWRGVGDIGFFAGNPETGFMQEVHRIQFLNTLDESLFIVNPSLSASFRATNITDEVSFWSGCVDISVEGGDINRQQYGEYTATRTVSSGNGIVALASPHEIDGRTNTRDLELARVTIASDKKVDVKLYRTRDLSAITGGVFETFRTGSFVEKNDTFTAVNTSLMEEFATFKIPAGGTIIRNNPRPGVIEFNIIHGDIIVAVCDVGAQASIEVTHEWGEEI